MNTHDCLFRCVKGTGHYLVITQNSCQHITSNEEIQCSIINVYSILLLKKKKIVDSIQILTSSSAMVKTMTPEVIPGAFYFPEAKPRGNRTLRGSARES